MISRKRCKAIAHDWVVEQGNQEYYRRMRSLDLQYADHNEILGLYEKGAEMWERGRYDPPTPKIPNLFRRLLINDWMPPESDWPMSTKNLKEERPYQPLDQRVQSLAQERGESHWPVSSKENDD